MKQAGSVVRALCACFVIALLAGFVTMEGRAQKPTRSTSLPDEPGLDEAAFSNPPSGDCASRTLPRVEYHIEMDPVRHDRARLAVTLIDDVGLSVVGFEYLAVEGQDGAIPAPNAVLTDLDFVYEAREATLRFEQEDRRYAFRVEITATSVCGKTVTKVISVPAGEKLLAHPKQRPAETP